MADIQLVIKIPEKVYKYVQQIGSVNMLDTQQVANAIFDGIPLPKGHGDLKDFQKMYADMTEKEELARQRVIDTPTNSPCYMRYVAQLNERTAFKEMLFDATTIIKADQESEGN